MKNAKDMQEWIAERDELRQMLASYDVPMPGVQERLAEVNAAIETLKARQDAD